MPKKLYRILIAHGFKAAPDRPPWLKWLKDELTKDGHTVYAPSFPTPAEPKMPGWIAMIEQTLDSNFHNVIFLGHSLGGLAILRALEAHKIKDKQSPDRARAVFLVASPFSIENRPKEALDFVIPPYDWKKIRQRIETAFHIYSDDDPRVAFKDGLEMRRFLGGKFIPMKRMGHFDHQDKIPKIKYLIDQFIM